MMEIDSDSAPSSPPTSPQEAVPSSPPPSPLPHIPSARGLADLPNEILEKILLYMVEYKIGKEAKDHLRLASKSMRRRCTAVDRRFRKYKIRLNSIDSVPDNALFHEFDIPIELVLYDLSLKDASDNDMLKLKTWLDRIKHRIIRVNGTPTVLSKVLPSTSSSLTYVEAKGKKYTERALTNPWLPSLNTLWLECVNMTICSQDMSEMPNLKSLYLRDVILTSAKTMDGGEEMAAASDSSENQAAKKSKVVDSHALAVILKACRKSLEYLEFYTVDTTGMKHFDTKFEKLKKIRLVRSNYGDALNDLLRSCENSLEIIQMQEMDLSVLADLNTTMKSLKKIEVCLSLNDAGLECLIEAAQNSLEGVNFTEMVDTRRINYLDAKSVSLPKMKYIGISQPRNCFGLYTLIKLSSQSLEVIDLEKTTLCSIPSNLQFELPSLRIIKLDKCHGQQLVVSLLRAGRFSIEYLDARSLILYDHNTINFSMPRLKTAIIGTGRPGVIQALKEQWAPDANIRYRRGRISIHAMWDGNW